MSRTNERRYRRNRERIKRHTDTCALCGQWINPDLTWPNPHSFSADHITPIHQGGPNDGALQATHLICNQSRKRKQTPQETHARTW